MSSFCARGSSLAKKEIQVKSTISDSQIGENIPKDEVKRFEILSTEDVNNNFIDYFEISERTANAKSTDSQSPHGTFLDDEKEDLLLLRGISGSSDSTIIKEGGLLVRRNSRRNSWSSNKATISRQELLLRQKSWNNSRSTIAQDELLLRRKSWHIDKSTIETKQNICLDEVSTGFSSTAADISTGESPSDYSKKPDFKRRDSIR